MVNINGRTDLVRDIESRAILNTDLTEYENYLARRDQIQQQKNEINNIKNELAEIKNLLKQLLRE